MLVRINQSYAFNLVVIEHCGLKFSVIYELHDCIFISIIVINYGTTISRNVGSKYAESMCYSTNRFHFAVRACVL